MSNLAKILEAKLHERQMSPYQLEKSAGLNPTMVVNILAGRSKNPTINTITAIANSLGCSVDELLGIGETLKGDISKSGTHDPQIKGKIKPVPLNEDLLRKVVDKTLRCLALENREAFTLNDALNIIEETYKYTLEKGLSDIDEFFIKWFIKSL